MALVPSSFLKLTFKPILPDAKPFFVENKWPTISNNPFDLLNERRHRYIPVPPDMDEKERSEYMFEQYMINLEKEEIRKEYIKRICEDLTSQRKRLDAGEFPRDTILIFFALFRNILKKLPLDILPLILEFSLVPVPWLRKPNDSNVLRGLLYKSINSNRM